MTTTLCSGQQQSFRPFGLSVAQRSYMPDSLRELDSQRRNNKSETFVTLHPSLSLTTSPSNHLGMFYHCGFTLGLHLSGILFFFLIVAFIIIIPTSTVFNHGTFVNSLIIGYHLTSLT